MKETYATCAKCHKINRVKLDSGREPVCGACQAPLPVHGAVVDGRDADIQTLLAKSPLPVVVDVWAPWCGPCRSFAPTFSALAEKFAGRVVFVKLNSDENPQTAGQWAIRGIPSLLVFKGGREVSRQSGAMPPEMFERWLNESAL